MPDYDLLGDLRKEEGHGSQTNDPTYVTLVDGPVTSYSLAPKTIKQGVSGTVSVPAGARLHTVNAVSGALIETSTVTIHTQDPVAIPAGRTYADTFEDSLEGPFDIVFANTESYYVTYFTGVLPSRIIIL